jgi:transcriptional regulator with XRE-family HTH domain
MAGKIELLEDEEKIHKIFEERWKKIKRNGWTQNDIAKKLGCTQGYFSQCLNQKQRIQYDMYEAVSLESGVSIEDILKEWEPLINKKSKRRKEGRAASGNILYILEQRENTKPVAKIGITNDLQNRLKTINNSIGATEVWSVYGKIELGEGVAFKVETEVKKILKDRFKKRNTEVFLCKPEQIYEVANRHISSGEFMHNPTWSIKLNDRKSSQFDMYKAVGLKWRKM